MPGSPPYASDAVEELVITAGAQHFCIIRKGDDRIASVNDIDGLKVGVQPGSVQLSRLPKLSTMLKPTGGTPGERWPS